MKRKRIKFRNFWPQGTRGGVMRVVPGKKGKGSYKRHPKHRLREAREDGLSQSSRQCTTCIHTKCSACA